MSVKKFKFVSPGIFVNEIDNSQLPSRPQPVGPVIIGRSERGPAFRPTVINSFSDFVNTFGNPVPGPTGGDVWRHGVPQAPTYAAYAAQAYLKNNSPITFIRVLGDQNDNQDSSTYAKAGFNYGDTPDGGATAGGAYALWMIPSASANTSVTGTLAAIWYTGEGGVQLSSSGLRGNLANSVAISGSNALMKSVGAAKQYIGLIKDSAGTNVEQTLFNFDRNSAKYIRKVFNTNPTYTNTNVTAAGANGKVKTYWLGPTYERAVADTIDDSSAAAQDWGVVLGFNNASAGGHDFNFKTRAAQTGWFISQDLRQTNGDAAGTAVGDTNNVLSPAYDPTSDASVTKLFKIHSLSTGEWEQQNLKISIMDIKRSTNREEPYGTFSIVIRKMQDTDNSIQVVEKYSNCNLNPNSLNYVARRVGDTYVEWDTTSRRNVEYGNYPNRSRFLRMEMANAVDTGQTDPEFLPFGVHGPVKFASWTLHASEAGDPRGVVAAAHSGTTDAMANYMVYSGENNLYQAVETPTQADNGVVVGVETAVGIALDALMTYPSLPLRVSASDGNLSDPTEAFFGVDVTRAGAQNLQFEESVYDLVRPLPGGVSSFATSSATAPYTEWQYVFSLDDVSGTAGAEYSYNSGSRAAGKSITAKSGSYRSILDAGFDRFTTVLAGGFDGLDITEKEPFNMSRAVGDDVTEKTSYAFHSLKKAIDMVADPEYVPMNLAAMPGITNEGLTAHLVNTCENRGDALAIIDLKGGYTPNTEAATSEQTRIGTRGGVNDVVDNLENRGLNSSYGCAYWPWVRIRDSINGASLWAPPSVAALGTLASSERKTAPWFAPAGFNRGGLSAGAAGIPVVGVRSKLTVADRDKLYDAGINPIASFPAEGIVVFGQKTLQLTESALDRINVRRLMIHIKREISKIATTVLFEQNVSATWNSFRGKAVDFLTSVQTGGGLTDFRVVLDETTTTPDLVDRNILYAKVFLKPARAIEFIAVDFNITRTGAAFAD